MSFNAQDYLNQTGGTGLSEGWHSVKIEEVINKTSSKGNQYVSVTLGAPGGKCWLNLNIGHPNPKADEIARRELAQIMIACGCNSLRDPMNPVEIVGKQLDALLENDGSFLRPKSFRVTKAAQAMTARVVGPPALDPIAEDDIPF